MLQTESAYLRLQVEVKRLPRHDIRQRLQRRISAVIVLLCPCSCMNCDVYDEMPAPNRQGVVTNTVCSSHGNDRQSAGPTWPGHSPIRGGTESPLVCRQFTLSAVGTADVTLNGKPIVGFHVPQGVEEINLT